MKTKKQTRRGHKTPVAAVSATAQVPTVPARRKALVTIEWDGSVAQEVAAAREVHSRYKKDIELSLFYVANGLPGKPMVTFEPKAGRMMIVSTPKLNAWERLTSPKGDMSCTR